MSIKLPSLSHLLTVDAVTCLGMGATLLVAAEPLAALFRLPDDLLRYAGAVLLPFAVLLGWAGRQHAPKAWVVLVLAAANVAWVVASLALLASRTTHPSAIGIVFVLVQAGAVAVITAAEVAALRSRPVPA